MEKEEGGPISINRLNQRKNTILSQDIFLINAIRYECIEKLNWKQAQDDD